MSTNNEIEKVSIIIPVYNSEKFLRECVTSIVSQTYENIEIIAIDDGSTDNSLKILNEFSSKIKIISQKNQGLASALNSGINIMNGKWLKWFSPDDLMYPETVALLVEHAKSLDENTIVYSNWDIIDEYGHKQRSFVEENYNDLDIFDFNIRLYDFQQINVNTALIPRYLFDNGLRMNTVIDPVLVDYDFFLRAGLLHQTRFNLIPKPLIKFRIHSNQLSHKNIVSSLRHLKIVRKEILELLNQETKTNFKKSFKKFRKKKSISKKFMELLLSIVSNFLPSIMSDKILVFYINKIRSHR